MIKSVLVLCASYLIGAFPTAYIIAKKLKGVDIREHGSGNVGSTNPARVLGKVPGIITLIIDVVKGYATVMLVKHYAAIITGGALISADLLISLSALFVVCGHNWPVYLKFRGGKGVATTCGVFFALAPLSGLISVGFFAVCFLMCRIVSISSMLSLILLPLIMFLRHDPKLFVYLAVVLSGMTILRHKSNIVRLLNGKEIRMTKKQN